MRRETLTSLPRKKAHFAAESRDPISLQLGSSSKILDPAFEGPGFSSNCTEEDLRGQQSRSLFQN